MASVYGNDDEASQITVSSGALANAATTPDGILPLPVTCDGPPDLSHVFPTAESLRREESIELGIPSARRASLKALAGSAVADRNLFRPFVGSGPRLLSLLRESRLPSLFRQLSRL